MKVWTKILAACVFLPVLAMAAENPADNITNTTIAAPNPNTDTPPNDLPQYLLNLGWYLGFDLTLDPSKGASPLLPDNPIRTLIDSKVTEAVDNYLLSNFIAALPVNSLLGKILPGTVTFPNASLINGLANMTFANYSSPSFNKISVNPLVDQNIKNSGFQKDPINQTLINILGTPDNSFCGGNVNLSQEKMEKCAFLSPNQLSNNVIGTLPSPLADDTAAFYSPAYLQPFLSQLNSSSLLAPLRYSTDTDTSATSKSGLTATSQATQAANFIRYASGTVIPLKTVNYDEYSRVHTQATGAVNANDAAAVTAKFQAQDTLNTYFANLRVYAARASVGIGNLYYILSKRMDQNIEGNVISQAQNEFNMATRRLNLNASNDSWIEQINHASAATVQKEMAVLLAEINYQLYLNRQQEERMLLTQSILLLQLQQPPPADLQPKR